MTPSPRVLLIGGTSHAGKSTVARALAERLNYDYRSTDSLARHPGRPWQPAPGRERLVEVHYESLTVEELIADVLRHYRDNAWPLVEQIVFERLATDRTQGLVIEGSALLPHLVGALDAGDVGAAWLVLNDGLLRRRIHSESGYEMQSSRTKALIDKFVSRTLRFNELLDADLRRLKFPAVRVDEDVDAVTLADSCLAAAVSNRR